MAITKCINSESKQYKPVLTDKLVLDAVPTVNSLNSVTSDAVARAIAGASGEVPQVTENDNGKVLKAVYDAGGPAVEWGEATVDQTYDATSTNAQSGVAVASAIAAIPPDVTTASGHFDLEGSVPVTVNYTGTPHVVPGTATFTNPTITEIGQTGLAVVFTLNPAHALTATESGALHIPANSPVSVCVTVSYTNSTSGVGGPGITISPSLPTTPVTADIIQSGDYTLTSQYSVPGYDQYVGLMFTLSSESDRPALMAWAESLTLDWPSSVVDGYETTIPVVDQNYHSESANAQSGVAVAQAIAAIPSAPTYTAGDGIDLAANEVSVKAGDGLSFESAVSSTNLSAPAAQTGGSTFGHSLLGQLDAATVAALKTGTVTVKPLFAFKVQIDNGGVHFAICQKNGYNTPNRGGDWLVASDAVSSATSGTYTMTVGDSYTVDFSTLDAKSTTTWSTIEANPTGYYLQLISYDTSMPLSAVTDYASVNIGASVPTEDVVTVEVGDPSASKTIVVSNPLPASAVGDAGKVLTVDNSGAAAWATPSAGGGTLVQVTTSNTYAEVSALIADGKVPCFFESTYKVMLYCGMVQSYLIEFNGISMEAGASIPGAGGHPMMLTKGLTQGGWVGTDYVLLDTFTPST